MRMMSVRVHGGVCEDINPVTDAAIAWITALRRSNGDTTIKLILFHSFSLVLLNRMSEITKRMTALCFVEHSD